MEQVTVRTCKLHQATPLVLLHLSVMVSITGTFFPRVKKAVKGDPVMTVGNQNTQKSHTLQTQHMSCLEQRSGVKMGVRLGWTPLQIHHNLRAAYGGGSLSITQVRMWAKRFQDQPNLGVGDAARSGRPKTVQTPDKIQAVMDKIQEDRRVTVRKVAHHCSISPDTAWRILKRDKNMVKLAPKIMSHCLMEEQKDFRKQVCQRNIDLIQNDPGLLHRIVTMDKSWIFSYDPHTKQADMEWTTPEEPHPVKMRRSRSQSKTMLTVFFDASGVIYSEFKDAGTVDSECYIQTLKRFHEAMCKKRKDTWDNWSFVLLQDNAPAYVSNLTLDYFHRVQMDLFSHPPYSPDLTPCDFWLFPTMKKQIRGHRFQNLDDLRTAVLRILRSTPCQDYQSAMDRLLFRYQKCVEADGDYFERKRKKRGSRWKWQLKSHCRTVTEAAQLIQNKSRRI